MSEIVIVPMSADRRDDFGRIHCDANDAGWCRCVAWWVPTWDGWGDRTAEENRSLRDELFDRGHYDGYLLYIDGEPVGWCQCGPRDRLPKLCEAFGQSPDAEAWAISCFVIAPSHRGRGLMRRLLLGVIADLRRRGVHYVQGFPTRGEGLEPGEAWTGPESVFQDAGFTLEKDSSRRPIYGLRLV